MKKIKMMMMSISNFVCAVIFASLFIMGCSDDDSGNTDDKNDLAGKLLILQAYSSASDAAGATHSFVELYNITDDPLDLSGVYLYFADGRRKNDSDWDASKDKDCDRIPLNGTIPAKGSFLILGPRQNEYPVGNASAARYQIPDNYGDVNDLYFILSNRAFKAALIKGTVNLDDIQNPFNIDGNGSKVNGYIDMVGAINTAPNAEQSNNYDRILGFETAPARCSKSEAVRRKNLTDTDNNQGVSAEFPDGTGDFVSIRYAADGISDELLEVRRPRNSSAGSWDPFAEPEWQTGTSMLMILQIGAATDGNISRSFAELYNNTASSINLSGYSLQYAAGFSTNAGNGAPDGDATTDAPWNKLDLTGTIQPYHSFLILGPEKTTASGDSPPALAFSSGFGDMNEASFELNNRAVKVALVSNTALLTEQNPFDIDGNGTKATGYVDMVGALNTAGTDNINGYESNPITNLNKQAGQRRKTLEDTNNNAADFERATFSGMVTKSGGVITAYSSDYEIKSPKNHAYGSWNPMTGETLDD